MTADSYERCSTTDPFLERDMLDRSARSYLAGADPRDALASPVFASSTEVGALAPLFIQAAAGGSPSYVAQYCVPQDDDSVTVQKIYCHGPG